ncbi:Rpn family recombination-promoting nuclease/putative transposase [Butyricicoccus sp.]|uniref:Rpn family recombination-promoting nuclease/putative transposase n=1 Tax=Butyricicoccus sp. TaxID=2049021 RepID=UPI003F185EEA
MNTRENTAGQFLEKDLRHLREFRLLDDDYMTKFFEDNIECTELLLRIILENEDLRVDRVTSQYSIKNLQGRSVRLDVYAQDRAGKHYNIEIQRSDKGAGVKRARYNSSMIDANSIDAGDEYDKLADTYVIFITEHDVLDDDLPVYHIERIIRENGKSFGDGSHIIYVNAQHKEDTPLGRLMQDFACKNPRKMHYLLLAERARYLKEDAKGVATMCKMMEDMRNEAVKEKSLSIVRKMLAIGKLTYEEIASCSDLTVEEVEALDKDRTA